MIKMDSLPDELTLNVMRFCTISTVNSFARVSKKYNLLYKDDVIWQQKYKDITKLDVRPIAWKKYPWFLSVKDFVYKKYNLVVYSGKHDDYYEDIFVANIADSGRFSIYTIINKYASGRKTYLAQNVIRWMHWEEKGKLAQNLSELSSPRWWFDIFARKKSQDMILIVMDDPA